MLGVLPTDAFFDELEKIAQTRSIGKDFAAGVDPFGSVTFGYGLKDAPISEGEAAKRNAAAVGGGLVGGAVVVPAAISGAIGAAKGATKGGLRGAVKGGIEGAHSIYSKIYRGVRGNRSLGRVQEGKIISPGEVRNLATLAEQSTRTSHPVIEMAKVNPSAAGHHLRRMGPEEITAIRGRVSGDVTEGIATLGLSGAIGGTAAHMQYNKGRATGKLMSPQGRATASGNSEAAE